MQQDYSRFARTQAEIAGIGLKRALETLVDSLEVDTLGHLHLVDIGTADGVNSFPVVEQTIQRLEDRLDQGLKNCIITHVDLPSADFPGLMHNIYHHPDSYLSTLRTSACSIQPSFVPASFYQRYVCPESADIVFSTTALHYASGVPCQVRNHVEPLQAAEEERVAWRRLSREDLDSALRQVWKALKPGGKFWAVAPAHTCDQTTGEVDLFWNRELWQLMVTEIERLVADGEIDSEAWQAFVIPVHQRHLSEWTNWFSVNTDLFELEYAELIAVPNPYLADYLDDHRDCHRFATEYCGFVRAWGDRIVGELIPDDERRDAFFDRLWQIFADEPERFAQDNISVSIGATRR
jgi:SAM-dependent methyltransferase